MDWKLEVVVIPVADVEHSKQFYQQNFSFPVDYDITIGTGDRLVQLTPMGSGCSIMIGSQNRGMEPGSLKGIHLVVDDIQAAQTKLIMNGASVSGIKHFDGIAFVDGRGGRWNSFLFLSDPDGNEWVIQERPQSNDQ